MFKDSKVARISSKGAKNILLNLSLYFIRSVIIFDKRNKNRKYIVN